MDLQLDNQQEVNVNLEAGWKKQLSAEFSKPYFLQLKAFLEAEKKQGFSIYPAGSRIFAAFENTPFDAVKVVIIGQDPYHGPGQANGLCFSVSDGIRKPPSLLNIFKELQDDLGIPVPLNGNLEEWARQGVLLLNATLTVRANEAGAHQKRGWEEFTDEVIRTISAKKTGVIFLLWGKYAQAKEPLIDTKKHYILEAAHPSPLARTGFKGCKHFSKTNSILQSDGRSPIDWRLEK
jgi:uracil-DNA glycosylase